jgi:hypothetical protein
MERGRDCVTDGIVGQWRVEARNLTVVATGNRYEHLYMYGYLQKTVGFIVEPFFTFQRCMKDEKGKTGNLRGTELNQVSTNRRGCRGVISYTDFRLVCAPWSVLTVGDVSAWRSTLKNVNGREHNLGNSN